MIYIMLDSFHVSIFDGEGGPNSRHGKEGFVGEVDLHPRLSWGDGHPSILKNIEP
jgi:hypothetical protein